MSLTFLKHSYSVAVRDRDGGILDGREHIEGRDGVKAYKRQMHRKHPDKSIQFLVRNETLGNKVVSSH